MTLDLTATEDFNRLDKSPPLRHRHRLGVCICLIMCVILWWWCFILRKAESVTTILKLFSETEDNQQGWSKQLGPGDFQKQLWIRDCLKKPTKIRNKFESEGWSDFKTFHMRGSGDSVTEACWYPENTCVWSRLCCSTDCDECVHIRPKKFSLVSCPLIWKKWCSNAKFLGGGGLSFLFIWEQTMAAERYSWVLIMLL